MPRARMIKYGFFTNDELAEIEPLGRLLFAGLWTIADREGRLEDRAKKIKVEVLPYDDCDIDFLLNELHTRGFITRYEVDGVKYIQITNFSRHQNPHQNEKASTIPPCSEGVREEYCASTIQAPEMNSTNRACNLNIEHRTLNIENRKSDSEDARPKKRADDAPINEIVEHYKQLCPSLPQPRAITQARRTAIKARWTNEFHKDYDELDSFFRRIENSDFLTGRTSNNANFCNIDWIFKQDNCIKILEGKYDKKHSSQTPEPISYPAQNDDDIFDNFGMSQAALQAEAERMKQREVS